MWYTLDSTNTNGGLRILLNGFPLKTCGNDIIKNKLPENVIPVKTGIHYIPG